MGVARGLIHYAQPPQVRLRIDERVYTANHRTPTPDEVATVIAALDGEEALMVQLLAATGARVGEVLALRRDQIDPARGLLRLDGKTGPRDFPLTEGLLSLVTDRLDGTHIPLIVPTVDHPQQRLRYVLTRACAALGVPVFTPHGLRRLGVDRRARAGVEPPAADVRRVVYWQASVHSALDDPEMGRHMLQRLLTDGPDAGDDPGFDVRVRIGLAQEEFVHGSLERARMYLEEASAAADQLDVRRRASYYDTLAKVRSAAGDHEAAVRAGTVALTLLREVGYELQAASMENDMAMTFAAMGAMDRAEEMAGLSIATFERLEAWSDLGHVIDTLATIRLARDDAADALQLADRSLALEAEHGPADDQVGARITRAKALEAMGRRDEAEAAWAEAIEVARRIPSASRRRRILSTRAKDLADQGRHAEAYELLAAAS